MKNYKVSISTYNVNNKVDYAEQFKKVHDYLSSLKVEPALSPVSIFTDGGYVAAHFYFLPGNVPLVLKEFHLGNKTIGVGVNLVSFDKRSLGKVKKDIMSLDDCLIDEKDQERINQKRHEISRMH